MARTQPTEPITIRAAKETIGELDALAAAMDRTRNYVVKQAIQLYLETNAWQIERIRAGQRAAAEGRVEPAEKVFDRIADKHRWKK